MKRIFFIFNVFLCIFLVSCGQKSQSPDLFLTDALVIAKKFVANGDTIVVCDLSLAKDTLSIYLEDLGDECELTLLDSENEAALVSEGQSVVSENNIGIYSSRLGKYKLFNKKGEYISTLSSRGSGPGEYLLSIYDSYIDEARNEVYLLPMMGNKILVYSFQNDLKEIIPLPYKAHKGRMKIDPTTNLISIGVLPFKDSPSIFWQQDKAGNIVKEVSTGHLTIEQMDYSNEVDINLNTHNFDLSLFYWIPCNDTLYHYDETSNRLKGVFTATFKTDNVLPHAYVELPNHYLVRIYEPVSYKTSTVLLDKKTLKGNYVKFQFRSLGGFEVASEKIIFRNGFYWANLYPYEFMAECERILSASKELDLSIKESILQLLDQMDDDSNNIILSGRLTKSETTPDNPVLKINPINNRPRKDKAKKATASEDTDDKTYGFKDLGTLKEMPAVVSGIGYFRNNSLYKDWDPKDEKRVLVSYIVEKDGTSSDVKVETSSGIEKLDREAVRLIKEARFTRGINQKSEIIRCGDMKILVFFPPR